ncbi:MAG: alpha/beta fold hydrolase [Lachnospiraceae bacterium]|nr:alpha/beta fold hydrolase [Lachnospiraceae bacterium]
MSKKHTFLKIVVGIGVTLTTIHVINRVLNRLFTGGNHLKAENDDFYSWTNGQIYLKKTGTGKPLLLLHDLTTYGSSVEWERVVAQLAANHTVYEIDLPGCGRSDKKSLPYVSFFYVQLIQSVLSEVIGEKADIAATGAAAPILLSAANYDGSLIDKIIVINPYKLCSEGGALTKLDKFHKSLKELPIIGSFFYNMRYNRMRIESLMSNDLFYNPFNVSTELVEKFCEGAHLRYETGRYLMAAIDAGYMNVNDSMAVAKLQKEALIISGAALKNESAMASEYQALNHEMQHVVIEKSGMYPQIEEPEVFVEVVEKFLQGENVSETIFQEDEAEEYRKFEEEFADETENIDGDQDIKVVDDGEADEEVVEKAGEEA